MSSQDIPGPLSKCPDRAVLFAFSVGRLPASVLEWVGEHIDNCSSCLRELEGLNEVGDPLVAGLGQPVPPGVFSGPKDQLPAPAPTDAPDPEGDPPIPGPGSAVPAGPSRLSPSTELRYRPRHCHARGGLGEVHVAHDQELDRDVALKRIREDRAGDAESRRRFLQEAEITGKLEHPGIVPVYGLVRGVDGEPCYAMRFVQGDTLKDAIERFHKAYQPGRDPGERSLALRQLLGRFVAVCNTVAYAHSRGIIHRDLKPANIMLGKYGETLVVDWGLAKYVGEEGKASSADQEGAGEGSPPPSPSDSASLLQWASLTGTGQVVGTPAFMAPEQAWGKSRLQPVGPASDLYSLGATLYVLLTGRVPFPGRDVVQVLEQVSRGDFRRPRQVKPQTPAALEAICLKAMALKPEDRYPTALALATDVEHWLADEPATAYREPWQVRLGRGRGRVGAGPGTAGRLRAGRVVPARGAGPGGPGPGAPTGRRPPQGGDHR
jgi:tRNA A-37 threonylcarbamoyl transferase component Bud32